METSAREAELGCSIAGSLRELGAYQQLLPTPMEEECPQANGSKSFLPAPWDLGMLLNCLCCRM